jgi:hypothetical protein
MKIQKKYIEYVVYIILIMTAAVTGSLIYNWYNPIARALMGVSVLYLLYKIYFRSRHTNINWIDIKDSNGTLKYIIDLIYIYTLFLVISLSINSIFNFFKWVWQLL